MNHDILLILLIALLLAALIAFHVHYGNTKKEYLKSQNINNTLMEISNEISQFKDIDELYRKMLEYTLKLIRGTKYGSIIIYDRTEDRMEFKALAGYDINEIGSTYLRKEELFLYSLNKLSGPGIIINPLTLDKKLYKPYDHEILKNAKQLIYKSILSAPFYIDGEFFGCISIDSIDDVNAFSKKDIEIIKYICVHLEMVIKNMLHVDGMKRHLITDSLTGLFNRRYYNDLIEYDTHSELEDSTIIMIDMDNFKQINDTYGHFKGDEILKFFSDLLRTRFRKSDTIIRFAGDEFLLVLNNCDEKNAVRILTDIQDELRANPYQGILIAFSYGTSRFQEGQKFEELVKAADSSMYMQKAAKK